MSGTYLFTHDWEGERQRLEEIAAEFDPGTVRHLMATGLGAGWRCLEVGGGVGSVARFMADRAGPAGRVVVTDLDTRFLEPLAGPTLVVRRHDIVADDLEEAAFDLVHARLLLEHLRDWRGALARMARALAPGGWLVVEALEWSPVAFAAARPDWRVRALHRLLPALLPLAPGLLHPAGLQLRLGHRLPAELERLGLTEVSAEGRAPLLRGGSAGLAAARLTLSRFEALIDHPAPVLRNAAHYAPVAAALRAPPVRDLVSRTADLLRGMLDDPGLWCLAPMLVASSGRRPAEP